LEDHYVGGLLATGILFSLTLRLPRFSGYASPEELLSSITDVSRQFYVDPGVRKDFLERLSRDKRARCEYKAWKKDGTTT
jgi:hypothetical protein